MNYELRIMNKGKRKEKKKFSHNSCFIIHDSRPRGFSLVETIVAIAILTLAMVAPLSLAQRGLNASIYARDQITAFYLAQEAIEFARNVRDTNNLGGSSGGAAWLSGLEECMNQACGMDVSLPGSVSDRTIACSSPTTDLQCQLVFNSTTGIYGDFGLRPSGVPWRTTVFNRTLQITPVTVGLPVNAEAGLVVTVSWRTGLITKSLTLNEKIFNWYPIAP
ncbi:MAG: prepilin-type N-terminal cleavage/methylation domain-containing protein [bacterium]|nr:prepilin-type N-terminal cleavage/methylation domain-containing protein [bacterium]